MSNKHRQQRGRPKGSGINDWTRLLTIAEVMERDPKLRVTTAIKQLGFHDPSTIRRLRDKFNANRSMLLQPQHAGLHSHRAAGGHAVCTRVGHTSKVESILKKAESSPQSFKRAQDALAEYANLADRPISIVSGFQASIVHSLLQKNQDQGLEYCI